MARTDSFARRHARSHCASRRRTPALKIAGSQASATIFFATLGAFPASESQTRKKCGFVPTCLGHARKLGGHTSRCPAHELNLIIAEVPCSSDSLCLYLLLRLLSAYRLKRRSSR